MRGFSRIELRTTTPGAAGEFYDAVLGHHGDGIVELPAAAAARGAPAHWLGYLAVPPPRDPEAMAARLMTRGAARLGPPGRGGPFILRDSGGVVFALGSATEQSTARVAWHQLFTADPAGAAATGVEQFGWILTDRVDLGALGIHQRFAWAEGQPDAGAIVDITGMPGLHPHWLFHFGVPALDEALAIVRARGGVAIGPTVLPDGVRIAAGEDAQGAAFGLIER